MNSATGSSTAICGRLHNFPSANRQPYLLIKALAVRSAQVLAKSNNPTGSFPYKVSTYTITEEGVRSTVIPPSKPNKAVQLRLATARQSTGQAPSLTKPKRYLAACNRQTPLPKSTPSLPVRKFLP